MEKTSQISIIETIKKRWKLILLVFILGIIFSVILYFVLPRKYESQTTLAVITSSSSPLSDLSSFASLVGINMPDESKKIMAILESRTLRERVIKKLDLIPVFFPEPPEGRNPLNAANEELKKIVTLAKNKKNDTIVIFVLHKDPKLAQKIGEAYIVEARKLLNEKKLSVAKFDRIYLEKKLKEEEERLRELQEKLAKFQKKTKIIEPNIQLKNLLEVYVNLLAKKTELLLKLNSISSMLSPDNPKVKTLRKQITYIDKQLKKLESKNEYFPALKEIPDILVRYTSLVRELKTTQAIYEALMKLYQQARLNESKEQLFIEVIDPPSLPDIPASPKKWFVLGIGSFLSLFTGILIALYMECCWPQRKTS